jgi:hypothetical protein
MPSPSFPGTRAEARARLRDFLPAAGRYAARRNHVAADHENVSRLSPALRTRLLLEAEAVAAVLGEFAFGTVGKFVQELVWRTYWKGWLELRPGAWRDCVRQVRHLRAHAPAAVLRRAEEVAAGRSGVAVMDGFARELAETGYLHNHARLWWAAFWIHTERLPWALGADFFFRHLLDADPASNTLSWRWVAGLQTRGKAYLVRRSNVEKYLAPERLAPAGLDALDDDRALAAEIADTADLTPQPLPELPAAPDHLPARWGLWLHPDDLAPEVGGLAARRPVAVAAITSRPVYARLGLSSARQAYLARALADGVDRAAAHFGCPGACADAATTAAGVAAWARAERLAAVVAHAPFVGPVGDALPGVRAALAEAGVALVLLRRPWDARLFPCARRGYFDFWARAQRWLKEGRGEPELPLFPDRG